MRKQPQQPRAAWGGGGSGSGKKKAKKSSPLRSGGTDADERASVVSHASADSAGLAGMGPTSHWAEAQAKRHASFQAQAEERASRRQELDNRLKARKKKLQKDKAIPTGSGSVAFQDAMADAFAMLELTAERGEAD